MSAQGQRYKQEIVSSGGHDTFKSFMCHDFSTFGTMGGGNHPLKEGSNGQPISNLCETVHWAKFLSEKHVSNATKR